MRFGRLATVVSADNVFFLRLVEQDRQINLDDNLILNNTIWNRFVNCIHFQVSKNWNHFDIIFVAVFVHILFQFITFIKVLKQMLLFCFLSTT